MRFFLLIAFSIFCLSSFTQAQNYIFGWPFIDIESMEPRGGTSKGPEINLDTKVSKAFKNIYEEDISDFERDRRAILAMSGPYRVSFDFMEMAGFEAGFSPARPYKSWGTEYVYVVADEGDYIALQHLLVMSIIDGEGNIQGPFVTKHWRQDWQYEPESVHRYQGGNSWKKESVDSEDGYWVQTVWQVDDSPRYAGWGIWKHAGDYSTWHSNQTRRPLPRREYSVREDYDLLIGENHHTVIADGWIQEEHNDKAVVNDSSEITKILAREYGIARYQRISDYDFSPGDQYMDTTAEFWHEVRTFWAALFDENELIRLKAPVDQEGLFFPLFERAQAIADGGAYDPEDNKFFIHETILSYLAEDR